ncbi:hypothetical protein [Streptomyces boncukensis]|uniref:Uncharacterized protein n=1 Tax=Streptomyces boncukensis TaxID=2711219 RepID=A0A6G4WPQ1_9ACTN|nr:hypothetical protein [Streptomyces boncukensis]NGO67068.1 hypothetical protein [Streptomyces boncukensis]
MTRYGFAIKALPKKGKPSGEDEDQDARPTDADAAAEDSDAEPQEETGDVQAPPLEPEQSTGSAEGEGTEPPPDSAEPPLPPDDARPWSGDMYDEGDETDPADAFAAYQGQDGEEAWLDQAQDGTLTGWVRDTTGQVWRYPDPDVWAIDVDDAHMTRTHSRTQDGDESDPPTEHGGQDPLFPSRS